MSKKSHVSFLRYSVFCISYHFTDFEICDAMMSISTMRQMEQRALYGNSETALRFFQKIYTKKRAKGLKIIVMVFPKIMFVRDKWIFLGLKMMHCRISESTLRIFFKFRTIKGGKKYIKIMLMLFLKKVLVWRKWTILDIEWVSLFVQISFKSFIMWLYNIAA